MKLSKKLIGSLAIVAVTAALAVGGTISYFSDTETSEGNTFTAGAVDLTVDSVGHYNGLICVGNKWQSCEAPNLETNLVDNGSFETPLVTATQNWQIFNSGTGWDIDWANDSQLVYQGRNRPEPALQEYHSGVLGDAKHGDQYTELDSDWFGPNDSLNGEPALIKISQDINTVAGMQYQLSYWFSPRPDTAAGNNEMKVYVKGKAGHAANPKSGINAITQSVKVIRNLEKWLNNFNSLDLGNSTLNIAYINGGGNQGNIIAENCEYTVEIRTADERLNANLVSSFIKNKSEKYSLKVTDIDIRHDLGNWITKQKDLQKFANLAPKSGFKSAKNCGYIDIQMLWNTFGKVPTFSIGAGKLGMSHKADEYVKISDVQKLQDYMEKLCITVLVQ